MADFSPILLASGGAGGYKRALLAVEGPRSSEKRERECTLFKRAVVRNSLFIHCLSQAKAGWRGVPPPTQFCMTPMVSRLPTALLRSVHSGLIPATPWHRRLCPGD